LLTRHWYPSSWRSRPDILRNAEWLVRVGEHSAEPRLLTLIAWHPRLIVEPKIYSSAPSASIFEMAKTISAPFDDVDTLCVMPPSPAERHKSLRNP
jgi:hypothetical protein